MYLLSLFIFSGVYGDAVTLEYLKDFHRRRVQILAESGADLIAFETIPNKLEAKAYAELLEEEELKIPAWFSFNSKDGFNVVSGDSVIECASIADSCEAVVAVGINCTPPRFIHGLILSIQKVHWLILYGDLCFKDALLSSPKCVDFSSFFLFSANCQFNLYIRQHLCALKYECSKMM